jgi:ATP-dependent DNA helicase RecG
MQMKAAENKNDPYLEVKFLKGVGEVRARQLARLGIRTVMDLLEYFPRAYIRRRVDPSLLELQPGERVAFTAMICWVDERPTRKGTKILSVGVSDHKVTIVCTWFSYPKSYPAMFKPGGSIWINGLLSEYGGQLQLNHPEFELIDDSGDDDFWKSREYLPVYGLSGTLTQKFLRRAIYRGFELFASQLEENLPSFLISRHKFLSRRIALQKMHFSLNPEEVDSVRRRFVYEDFFYSQILWARHRYHHLNESTGIQFENKRDLTTSLYRTLPFQLTEAQKKVLREIFADMTAQKQMSRLLQGDVGSGKTIVTIFAMLLAVENGYQAALMAPTEILADQHYGNLVRLLGDLPVRVVLLKGGSFKGKSRVKEAIETGGADLVIGTHALLQEAVKFYRLGLAAVDEQHRFGVQQRALLARKDQHPDLLYLSATPIPRSLSMTVYGDLEVSVIDELPPSRIPVRTFIRSNQKIDLVFREVGRELAAGRQLYVICPLIGESDKVDLLDAERLHGHLSTKVFPQYSCVLLHGRMPVRAKDEIMLRFKAGEIRILVSTTVIEVGIDVPNATVMIVEHAERFGLAQLHQLRGRVGRGAAQSYCYLIEHFPSGKLAKERLTTLAGTTDGFVIAEKDLQLRGPGEFFGFEQSGLPQFRFASILTDQDVLKLAREDAFEIVSRDPDLEQEEHATIRNIYRFQYTEREKLIQY